MKDTSGVCPWQAGAMLTTPLRKLFHNPQRILQAHLSAGKTAMDVGCGMGYFTIPMSRITGVNGQVIAVDLQPQMLDGLMKNAAKQGGKNIKPHCCKKDSLVLTQWKEAVDFVLLFWMLHEAPDKERLIGELHAALAPGGKLLFAEPAAHVSAALFYRELELLKNAGFAVADNPKIAISRTVVLRKA